jgi:hypothetical protein
LFIHVRSHRLLNTMSALPVQPWFVAWSLALALLPAWGQGSPKPVYRCPGPPVLYTDAISESEARAKSCRVIEGAPVTVIQGPARRTGGDAAGAARPAPTAPASPAASRPAETRIDAATQRARDTDSRRILEAELRREEEALAQLKRDFNNGEPERRGDERNFAKYQERVAEMRAAIGRKEADLVALRRELAKLPPPPP